MNYEVLAFPDWLLLGHYLLFSKLVPGFKNINNLPFNAVYFPAVEKVLQLPIEEILDPA